MNGEHGSAHVLFRSTAAPGFLEAILNAHNRVRARKRVHEIAVAFATADCTVQTREGLVHAHAGDAIITGTAGERWRVSKARFAEKYQPIPPTTLGEPGRYLSRPNQIMAVRMDKPFDVLLADKRSLLHGQPGDWLVDYGDGNLGIVGAAIFDGTYEILG